MNIFSGNKRVLIFLIVVLAVILITGFLFYKYRGNSNPSVENTAGGASTQEPSDDREYAPQIEAIKAEGTAGAGSLTICSEQCGDGVCTPKDAACAGDQSLNCVCPETPQDCPQDCPG